MRAEHRRRELCALASAVVLVLTAARASAGGPTLVLPADLPRGEAQQLRRLIDRATVSAHAAGASFVLRHGVFEYLLDHPDFATALMRALDVGDYRLWRRPDGLWLDDGGGAVGQVAIVYATSGRRVVHIRGHYTHRFVPVIHGEAVIDLAYASRPSHNGRSSITPTVTGVARIDNVVIHALAQVLAPVARAKAQKLARRIVGDLAETAQKIEADPRRAVNLVLHRPDATPHEVEEFQRLLGLW